LPNDLSTSTGGKVDEYYKHSGEKNIFFHASNGVLFNAWKGSVLEIIRQRRKNIDITGKCNFIDIGLPRKVVDKYRATFLRL
jgi:hypothetical protein